MVTRVSTTGNYSSVLANLMGAQLRQADANERVSSQKNGNEEVRERQIPHGQVLSRSYREDQRE